MSFFERKGEFIIDSQIYELAKESDMTRTEICEILNYCKRLEQRIDELEQIIQEKILDLEVIK